MSSQSEVRQKNKSTKVEIVAYCHTPRNIQDVAAKFKLDKKSTHKILNKLWLDCLCDWNSTDDTYTKCLPRENRHTRCTCYKCSILTKPTKPKKKSRRKHTGSI